MPCPFYIPVMPSQHSPELSLMKQTPSQTFLVTITEGELWWCGGGGAGGWFESNN